MDRDDLFAQLREFLAGLAAESGREFPARLDPDDNLFDLGLVTSFSVIRMILFVEDVTGCAIDLADHEPQSFYTLAGIHTLVTAQRQEESA
ncbi:acyl carrier protein [Kitasatospora sp. NBC_00315]|uniref:acyl carrier protein n=1 Tax=Kitasatospora sp. NBC_00315 TaxID=2975963 RepID=UPI0032549D91